MGDDFYFAVPCGVERCLFAIEVDDRQRVASGDGGRGGRVRYGSGSCSGPRSTRRGSASAWPIARATVDGG